jgi:hypothetical protein
VKIDRTVVDVAGGEVDLLLGAPRCRSLECLTVR